MARFLNALLTSAVVALCACSPTHSAPPRANLTNPNAGRPAPQAQIAERPTTRTSTSTPKRCRAAQLAPSSGGRGGAGGHLLNYLALTNTTNESCMLDGYPIVFGIEASGTKVVGTDGSFFPVSKGVVIVHPRKAATLGLETDTYCAASPAGAGSPANPARHFVLTIPESGSIAVTIEETVDLTRGLDVTPFFQQSGEGP